jgi:hydrogenase small subunit
MGGWFDWKMEVSMQDSFIESLESRGLTRRAFLGFCGSIAAAIGIEGVTAVDVAEAIESNSLIGVNGGLGKGNLAPVIWMELGSCTGCTESFAQSDDPDPATLLLEYLALNYSETLSASAGYSLEESREQTIEAAKGKYVAVIEGAVMTRYNGEILRIAGEATCAPGDSPLLKTCKNAAVVIAAGSCAVDGGFCAADPNPGGAEGVQKYLRDNGVSTPVVNLPSCPCNAATLVAVVVQYLLLGAKSVVADLNEFGMPKTYYGETIHDNCQRRGHFENGEFVYEFGSKEEALGYCLYAMGCKGPQTKANCATTRWNRRTSWCVDAGAPCIGCCSADPGTTVRNWVDVSSPFLSRMKTLKLGDLKFQPTPVALGVTGVIAAALVIHGIGMKATGRTKGGAPFEKARDYDIKHGNAQLTNEPAAEKQPAAQVEEGE